MPPFNAKEVCRFFFWIAVLLLVLAILFLLIWRSSGTKRIQLQPPGAAVLTPHRAATNRATLSQTPDSARLNAAA